MKKTLLANIHWIFFLMAFNNLYTIYEESEEKLESSKSSLDSLGGQKTSIARKLKSINRFKKNLAESKNRVEEVVKQIEKVQKQLPSDVNDAEVAGKVSDLGASLKLKDLTVTPQSEELSGFFFTKKYAVKADGTFLQALILFENLDKSERILNVKSFEIKEKTSVSRGRFKVLDIVSSIESYRYNASYKEKSGVKEIENKFKVP